MYIRTIILTDDSFLGRTTTVSPGLMRIPKQTNSILFCIGISTTNLQNKVELGSLGSIIRGREAVVAHSTGCRQAISFYVDL